MVEEIGTGATSEQVDQMVNGPILGPTYFDSLFFSTDDCFVQGKLHVSLVSSLYVLAMLIC